MNLYFRLILVLIKCRLRQKQEVMRSSHLAFRVWPLDCDINRHLTNSRYLAFMDLARIYHMGVAGVLSLAIKRKWFPVVHASEIVFHRPFKPFQKVELVTRLLSWDEKSWYIEQRFESNGKLHAHAMVKALLIGKEGRVPTETFFSAAGLTLEPLEPIEAIAHWQALIKAKWPTKGEQNAKCKP